MKMLRVLYVIYQQQIGCYNIRLLCEYVIFKFIGETEFNQKLFILLNRSVIKKVEGLVNHCVINENMIYEI